MIPKNDRALKGLQERRFAANDNDPAKYEYLRLAEAQDKLSGLVLVTLKTGIKLSVRGRFFVVSAKFREDTKITRKTVYNHLKKLVANGFIVQLDVGQGTFPAYRLTSLDEWRRMVPNGAADLSPEGEKITHGSGKSYPPYTPIDPDKPKASPEGSAAFVNEQKRKSQAPHIPLSLRNAFLEEFGEAKTASFVDRSIFDESTRCLDAWSWPARNFFYRDGRRVLQKLGVTLTYEGQPQ